MPPAPTGAMISYGPSRVPDCSRKYVKNSTGSVKNVSRGAFQTALRRADDLFQRQRVVDRVRGVVVVEVDVGGFQLALPVVDALDPLLELLIGVAALIFE